MRLSDLQTKSIVSINDGKNIGSIIDANINNDDAIDALDLISVRQLLLK